MNLRRFKTFYEAERKVSVNTRYLLNIDITVIHMKQFVLKCKNCDAGHLSNNFYYGAAKCIHTIT